MNRFLTVLSCTSLLIALSTVFSLAHAQGTSRQYERIYIENRCYQSLEVQLEKEKGSTTLPVVSARETEILYFGRAGQLQGEDGLLFRRYGMDDMRISVAELKSAARPTTWQSGNISVNSWVFATCSRALSLADPAGKPVRAAMKGEPLAEYEMLFSRIPGSSDPMHVYTEYPVKVLLDGVTLGILKTGNDGMLRFLLPAGQQGMMTLRTEPESISQAYRLGVEWSPVRLHTAQGGETLLFLPVSATNQSEW